MCVRILTNRQDPNFYLEKFQMDLRKFSALKFTIYFFLIS
jgi:hypothetical protein